MRSTENRVVLAIVVANVLTATVAVVTNMATEVVPANWRPYLWISWPVLGLLVICGIPLIIFLHRSESLHPRPITPERAEFSRKAMLSHLREIWVDGVLTRSLYRRTIAELGLQERPDAVRRPWDLMLEEQDQHPRTLDRDVRLADIVKRHRGLLVLGPPGAGKTTMLLTLLEDLLDDAAHDRTYPIPVVFPLSSWVSGGDRPLEEWFVDELCGPLYGLPRDLAEQWVDDERVLPLLDGLDEVAPGRRPACARAIDAFHATHRLLPLVVSSRAADYAALDLRLSLGAALFIQPLTRAQAEDYLDRLGEPVTGLREALRDEPSLWELLQTPFLLNVAVRAYQGLPAEDVGTDGTLRHRQSRLIADYVDRAVRRKRPGRRYKPSEAVRWLAFIARAVGRELETLFFVETADLTWLSPPRERLVAVLTAVPGGVLAGASIGLLTGLFFDLATGLASGIVTGIVVGAPLAALGEEPAVRHAIRGDRRATLVQDIGRLALFGGALGLMLVVLGAVLGLVVGAAVGVVADTPLLDAILRGVLTGLVLGVLNGFLLPIAVSGSEVGRQVLRHRPSGAGLRDAVWFGWASGALVGVPAVSVLGAFYGVPGVLAGMGMACAVAYLYAGRGLLGHWLARLVLIRAGVTPRRLLPFLDFAVEQTLMLKVGGGYMFSHRLLLEHFAGLRPEVTVATAMNTFLPSLDLRPEVILRQVLDDVQAAPGGIVRTLEYVGSALLPGAWVPAATQIADILRAGMPAEPKVQFPGTITDRVRHARTLAEVLRLIADADHGELSAAAAVALAELVLAERWGLRTQLHLASSQQVEEIMHLLRPIANSAEPGLAKRARTAIRQLHRYRRNGG